MLLHSTSTECSKKWKPKWSRRLRPIFSAQIPATTINQQSSLIWKRNIRCYAAAKLENFWSTKSALYRIRVNFLSLMVIQIRDESKILLYKVRTRNTKFWSWYQRREVIVSMHALTMSQESTPRLHISATNFINSNPKCIPKYFHHTGNQIQLTPINQSSTKDDW